MIIPVDKLEIGDVGGSIYDFEKIKIVLHTFKIDVKKLLADIPPKAVVPSTMFHAGKYIVFFQFNRDFTEGQMAFINYNISLQENFDLFADNFTPKTLTGYHRMSEIIRKKSDKEKGLVVLVKD